MISKAKLKKIVQEKRMQQAKISMCVQHQEIHKEGFNYVNICGWVLCIAMFCALVFILFKSIK